MIIIKNGNVMTMAGEPFTGDVAIENGVICAVGKSVNVPAEAEVIDAGGMYVLPGFVDAHCHIGMWEDGIREEGADGNECTNPLTPELRAIDAINPFDRCFVEAREGGVTTCVTGPGSANVVGGQFVAMKTAGSDVEDMIIKEPVAMKAAFGENPKMVYSEQKAAPQTRMATAALLRKQLTEAKEYARKLSEAEADPSKKPDKDLGLEAMLPVIRRELPLKIHAHRADDILTAIRIAKEFNIRFSLDHCTEGYMIPEQVKAAQKDLDAHVIIGPLLSERSKVELKNLTFKAAKVLFDAGIEFALMTDHPVIPEQFLPVCAAICVREGLSEDAALRSITINAARAVGIDDRVGSIEVGKDADIAIFDGHPLDFRTRCKVTLINGKVVYDER